MQSRATSVSQYLDSLPPDRRAMISAVREVILKNLDADYEEGVQYGMIGYYVPHRVFPAGYHCDPRQPLPYASLAAQKNHLAIYMMGLYCGNAEDGSDGENPHLRWFREAWTAAGKKLDMGKACVRFKKLEDLSLEVLGEAIRRTPAREYIQRYQESLAATKARPKKAAAKEPAAKKTTAKEPAAKKTTAKEPVAKKAAPAAKTAPANP